MTARQFALCEPTWDPDPEPDDEDNGPWCHYPDLWGQPATPYRLATMTTIRPAGEYL